ncbi:MAG TPA: hypothetical protein VFQ87_09485 [Bradyrhizobium sp.]|nr:hypothetical protein [Bradyrhizobium sp.]
MPTGSIRTSGMTMVGTARSRAFAHPTIFSFEGGRQRAALPCLMLQKRNEALAAPQFNIAAVYQSPGPNDGVVVARACEQPGCGKMPVVSEYIGAIFVHLGGASPGEVSHSLMCEAVSACRARRNSNSRARLPGISFSAASLNRLASSASRSPKVNLCLTRPGIRIMKRSYYCVHDL